MHERQLHIDSTVVAERPLVSVVIPYLDRPELLRRALMSVELQTYRPLEVIVVDDGSMVDPGALIAEMPLSLAVDVVRLGVNGGPSKARNAGIARSRGEYVAFLDSDDEWLPQKTATQVQAARSAGREAAVVCVAQTGIRWPDRLELKPLWDPAAEPLADFLFLRGGIMQTSSVLVSRDLARKVAFDPKLRQFEDILFLIQLQAAGAQFCLQYEQLATWYRDNRVDQLSRTISLSSASHFRSELARLLTPRQRLAVATKLLGPALLRTQPVSFGFTALAAMAGGILTLRELAGITRRSGRVRLI